jgi:hypothetical protein
MLHLINRQTSTQHIISSHLVAGKYALRCFMIYDLHHDIGNQLSVDEIQVGGGK